MEDTAAINVVININKQWNITANAACDIVAEQYVYFCTKIGLLFRIDLKFTIVHTTNDIRYKYLYRLLIKNNVYKGTKGYQVLLSLYRYYRFVIDKAANINGKEINLNDLEVLIGKKFNDDEVQAIWRLKKEIYNRLQKNGIEADIRLCQKNQLFEDQTKTNTNTPTTGDLFVGEIDKKVDKKDDESITTPYVLSACNVGYKNLCIAIVDEDQMPVILPQKIAEKAEQQYIASVESQLGDSITLIPTSGIYNRRKIHQIVIEE